MNFQKFRGKGLIVKKKEYKEKFFDNLVRLAETDKLKEKIY